MESTPRRPQPEEFITDTRRAFANRAGRHLNEVSSRPVHIKLDTLAAFTMGALATDLLRRANQQFSVRVAHGYRNGSHKR